MASKKRTKKAKAVKELKGRTPTLAPYVDNPFQIYAQHKGKEISAQVLKSGMIVLYDTNFTSPSRAASEILGNDEKGKLRQVDGWQFWKYNEGGKRVPLDELRGSKSPLKVGKEEKAA